MWSAHLEHADRHDLIDWAGGGAIVVTDEGHEVVDAPRFGLRSRVRNLARGRALSRLPPRRYHRVSASVH